MILILFVLAGFILLVYYYLVNKQKVKYQKKINQILLEKWAWWIDF